MYNMVKIIIFDFDQTLYSGPVSRKRNYDMDRLRKAFNELNDQEFDQILKKYRIMRKNITPDKVVEVLIAEKKNTLTTNSPYLASEPENMKKTIFTELIDNEVLSQLYREGYKLFIVSNSPKESVERNCKTLGIDIENFTIIGMPYLAGLKNYGIKNKMARYKQIMETENVEPQECLVIGNSYKADLIPAQNLGMRSVHCTDASCLTYRNIVKFCESETGSNVQVIKKALSVDLTPKDNEKTQLKEIRVDYLQNSGDSQQPEM